MTGSTHPCVRYHTQPWTTLLRFTRNWAKEFKVDIESAYRLILVHAHERPLQAVRWDGSIYIDPMLPFARRPKLISWQTLSRVIIFLFPPVGSSGRSPSFSHPSPPTGLASGSTVRLDLSALEPAVQRYFQNGLAPSTQKNLQGLQ